MPSGQAAGPAEAAQEKTEEKMAQADPAAAAEQAQVESEQAPAGGGGGTAGAEGAAGDSAAGEAAAGEAAAEGAAADSAAGASAEAPQPAAGDAAASPAKDAQPQADPESLQRQQSMHESRGEQADTQRMAEAVSDEHAQEQAEQQADSGGPAAGGAGGEGGELSSGEKSAGVAELGEDVGGGGGEGGGGAGGGGGGGGGGGAAAVEEAPAPDTAAQDPAAGLGAAAALGPVQAGAALGGVGSAIDRTAGDEAAALQEQMPQPEVGADGAPASCVLTDDDGGEGGNRPAPVSAEASAQTPAPEATPEAGPAPSEAVVAPSVSAGEGGKISEEDGARVQGAVDEMPTRDPGLEVSAGAAPKVELQGDADPAVAAQHKAELDRTVAEQQAKGAADAARPAGENAIRVTRPKETLKGPAVANPGGAGGKGAAADAAAAEEGVGIIAREKKGAEVSAAMQQAQADMAAKKGEHQAKVAEEKDRNDQEMARLREDNLAQQEAEKAGARADVAQARSDWTAEQREQIRSTHEKAGKEVAKGNEKVTAEQTRADADATRHIEEGDRQAGEEKARAEKDAAAKKAEAKKESGGVFGWLSSKVASFFAALKRGITAIFDAAKKLVRSIIDKAKKLAVAVIEAARKAIVAVIQAVGAALIALGDVFLAAFPGLKKRWRRFIESRVKDAENAVNRLADALKKGVTRLLDLLGKAFDFLLDAYKKAMFLVLDAAKAAVDGAIKFAKSVADLVGTFVVLIKDIAANPGGWIRNLGAAVMDGVRNHLWKSFKAAVKQWFNDKLEEVLGVGLTIWNILKKGGIAMKEVGQMAFEALKAAIPMALIQLLIEKVVAMIVPAAGAVMAIIEGLQAAWGTVQRIIAALGKFVTFLKAVKAGGAGPQFAELLASAAIVVIDFVANWLLRKLRGPASKVGSKVKAIAQKIMAKIKAAMKKVGGALKKVAKKIGGVFRKGKKKFDDWRAKRRAKKEAKNAGKKKDASEKKKDKAKKLAEAVQAAKAEVLALVKKPRGRWALRLRLMAILAKYRLRGVKSVSLKGHRIQIKANPQDAIDIEPVKLGRLLEPILVVAEREFLAQYDRAKDEEGAAEAAEGVKPSTNDSEVDRIQAMRRARNQGMAARGGDVAAKAESGVLDPEALTPGTAASWGYGRAKGQMRWTLSSLRLWPANAKALPPDYARMRRELTPERLAQLSPQDQVFLSNLGTLERARKQGMVPAMDMADALRGAGHATHAETLYGDLAPMATVGSSVDAHKTDVKRDLYEEKLRADIQKGGTTGKRAQETLDSRLAKSADARTTRHERIGNIFARLRQAVNGQNESILAQGGADLSALSAAVDQWLRAKLGKGGDRQEIKQRAHALIQQVITFLKAYRG